jgi:hypothetical protein
MFGAVNSNQHPKKRKKERKKDGTQCNTQAILQIISSFRKMLIITSFSNFTEVL